MSVKGILDFVPSRRRCVITGKRLAFRIFDRVGDPRSARQYLARNQLTDFGNTKMGKVFEVLDGHRLVHPDRAEMPVEIVSDLGTAGDLASRLAC